MDNTKMEMSLRRKLMRIGYRLRFRTDGKGERFYTIHEPGEGSATDSYLSFPGVVAYAKDVYAITGKPYGDEIEPQRELTDEEETLIESVMVDFDIDAEELAEEEFFQMEIDGYTPTEKKREETIRRWKRYAEDEKENYRLNLIAKCLEGGVMDGE